MRINKKLIKHRHPIHVDECTNTIKRFSVSKKPFGSNIFLVPVKGEPIFNILMSEKHKNKALCPDVIIKKLEGELEDKIFEIIDTIIIARKLKRIPIFNNWEYEKEFNWDLTFDDELISIIKLKEYKYEESNYLINE